MRPANSGHVINVISLAGIVAAPGETLYSATKHAAMAYTIGTLLDLRRSGVKGVDVSAVCPDGVWTPMLEPHVDDPDAWPSWSGVMLQPDQVGEAVAKLIDKPRPVLTLPRWRGGFVRAFAATPRLAVRALPLIVAGARRKQRAFAKRLESAPTEGRRHE
jgi:short-subunit dehydrogenase